MINKDGRPFSHGMLVAKSIIYLILTAKFFDLPF